MALVEGDVHQYPTNTNAFADVVAGPDGRFFVTYKVDNTHIAVDVYNPTTNSWSNYAGFSASQFGFGSTELSDDLDLVATNDGKLHLVFRFGDGDGSYPFDEPRGVGYGEFNGANWSFAVVEQQADPNGGGYRNFDNPRLAVDANGVAHIAYQYSDAASFDYFIRYATNASGTFVPDTRASYTSDTNPGINEVKNPTIDVAPDGTLRLTYLSEDNYNQTRGNLYYETKAPGGTWSPPALLDGTPGTNNPHVYGSIAADAAGFLHIFYVSGGAVYDLNNTSGSFQTTVAIPASVNANSITGYQEVGGVEYLLVTHDTNDTDLFRRTGSGSWENVLQGAKGAADTDVAVNAAGRMMIIETATTAQRDISFATDVLPSPSPTVVSVTSTTANGTYKVGDTISIQVEFSSAVLVTGDPRLTLETGSTNHAANFASGDGTSTLTFSYVVQAGDTSSDLDIVGTSALALNGGTIRDGSGNDAVLTLPAPGAAGSLGANKAIVVDGSAPTLTISSDASQLHAGQTANITFTFSEDPGASFAWNGNGGDVAVTGGTLSAISGAGLTRTATFTPTANTDAGTASITVASGTYTDAAGNPGGAGATPNLTFDTRLPTVASLTPSTAGPTNAATLTETVTFSEAVTGVDASDFTLHNADGSVAAGSVGAPTSTNGGRTYSIALTGLTGTGTVHLDLNASGTGIRDDAGNAIASGFTGASTVLDHAVPTITLALSAGTGVGVNHPLLADAAPGAAPGTLVLNAAEFAQAFRLNGTASDAGGFSTDPAHPAGALVTFTVGNTVVASHTAPLQSDGAGGLAYAFRVDAPGTAGGANQPLAGQLVDGTYIVVATTQDTAGNTGTSAPITLVIDTSADAGTPASLVVDGTGDGVLNAAEARATRFTVAGLDADASAVATFSDGTHTANASVAASGASTVDLTGFNGAVTASLAITDVHQNTATVAGNTVQADTTAPLVTFTASNGSTSGSVTHASFSGTASDAHLVGVQVFDHGNLLGDAQVGTDGHWSLNVDLASGDHFDFTAIATDAAGNSSSAAYTPPTGQPTPSYTAGITGQPFTAQTDYTDAAGHVTTSVYTKPDGSLYESVARGYDADGHLSFTNTTMADGTVTSQAVVAGNSNYASTFVVLDTSGHATSQVYSRADGSTYERVDDLGGGTSVTQKYDTANTLTFRQIDRPDGTHEVNIYHVTGQDYVSSDVLYDAAFHALTSRYDRADGSHLIVASQAGQHLFATSGPDVLTGAGSDTFVFHVGSGMDRISNFDVDHDAVQLSGVTDQAGLRAALVGAHDDASGNAVVAFSAHDTITFAGLHAAQIQGHAGDFFIA